MKKFLSNLYLWCVKIPVMMLILLIQNTWQIFLVGIIYIAVLVSSAFLNSGIPLFSFLTIATFFPVFFSVRNLKNCLHILKNGSKADGILTEYRCNKGEDFSEITFADSNGEFHSKRFRLFFISEPEFGKKFIVIYDPESPENFCISVRSLTGCIMELIFSIIIFTAVLALLIWVII